MSRRLTRRRFALLGSLALTGLAGCEDVGEGVEDAEGEGDEEGDEEEEDGEEEGEDEEEAVENRLTTAR